MPRNRIIFLMVSWLIPGVLFAAQPATESLSYRVYYQGLLSAMSRLPIADATLQATASGDGAVEVSTLSLSSAGYAVVDSLYPIRYRLRSLYGTEQGQLLAFERYKRTRKFKHDLAWLDAEAGQLHYLRADDDTATPAAQLPRRLRPWLSEAAFRAASEPPLAVAAGVLDRLSLLQRLRQQPPAAGQQQLLTLTDGRKYYRYRVTGVGRDSVTLAGRRLDAWRLRVEGFEVVAGSERLGEAEHPPIDVWLSDDPRRLPLRLQIDHAVGEFTVDWLPEAPPVEVVMEVPSAGPVVAAWQEPH